VLLRTTGVSDCQVDDVARRTRMYEAIVTGAKHTLEPVFRVISFLILKSFKSLCLRL